jgi:galactarate dehydratase
VPASALVVGVQCGGSDAFSASPPTRPWALHRPAGARRRHRDVLEVTEVRDGIDQLTARAASPEVAEAMIREMAWYDAYLTRAAWTAAPTPRRATRRAACRTSSRRPWAPSSRAARPHHRRAVAGREAARDKGLIYAATPASDFICGTLQLAAGMNLHVFTTGRGTPTAWPRCR